MRKRYSKKELKNGGKKERDKRQVFLGGGGGGVDKMLNCINSCCVHF